MPPIRVVTRRVPRLALLLAGLPLVAACLFGAGRGPRVLGHHAGRVVFTHGAPYAVGRLPAGWDETATGARAVIFRLAATGSTITTSAACGADFEDLPLLSLLRQLFVGVPAVSAAAPEAFRLDGRGALRARSVREVDGVAVAVDAVVVKKDGCSFDFILVASPGAQAAVTPDFEAFVGGFRYPAADRAPDRRR